MDDSVQGLKWVIQKGWKENKGDLPTIISPYFNMRDGMSVQDSLILKGEQKRAVKTILNTHLGVNTCLNRARTILPCSKVSR